MLKPFLISIGRTALTAAKSNTGKAIRKAISDQALDSALNMTKEERLMKSVEKRIT